VEASWSVPGQEHPFILYTSGERQWGQENLDVPTAALPAVEWVKDPLGVDQVVVDLTDRAALRQVFEENYGAISRYCHRRLPQDDANDATAQVFAVAWRRSDSMPQGDRTLPWLYGVARNEVRTSRRAARRLKNLHSKLGGQAAYPSPGPETVVVRHFEQEQILEALATPRPDDQEILRLRAYEHLTLPEIAVVLDCSVEAAKKRSSRAMKRLRKATDWADPHDAGQASIALEEGRTG
jgi:RNA polymerase sigma factor (sigma-70 family)